MKKIRILDCTLRDGGYCNNWKFGYDNIGNIIMGLENSRVEIIECGFIKSQIRYDKRTTLYSSVKQLNNILLHGNLKKTKYVCMVNYGQIEIDDIDRAEEGFVSGIRVAFHKKDIKNAIELSNHIHEKGYDVFLQPMNMIDYTEKELVQLIEYANQIKLFAFYIVDSFGNMKMEDLIKIYSVVARKLNEQTIIGFHSHNNLQLSYSNAQKFISISGNREVIIDSSIFGMGRGAGNLNTELFLQYLNDYYNKEYDIAPILNVFDNILYSFYIQKPWGYSLPNYISAICNSHPNYATFWAEKNTLNISDISSLFGMLGNEKKNEFDCEYAEVLYTQYMRKNARKTQNYKRLVNKLIHKKVLIIASGRSSMSEKEKIVEFIKKNNVIIISVNREYKFCKTDYIFVSNLRRFTQISSQLFPKLIVTSNVRCEEAYATIDYTSLRNNIDLVEDNATLMLINFLKESNVDGIYIAGLDGYSHDLEANYADSKMMIKASNDIFDKKNRGINIFLNTIREQVPISMITNERYIRM